MRNRKTTDAQFNLLFKKLHEMTDTQFDETFDHYMTQPEFALCMRKELFNALIDGDIWNSFGSKLSIDIAVFGLGNVT